MKLFALFMFFSFVSNANSQLVSKKEIRLRNIDKSFSFETKIQKQNNLFTPVRSKKSLLLAGVLSIIVPGASIGQFYKEEFVNGAIRLGISIISVAWFFLSPTTGVGGKGNADQKIMASLLFTVNWIASIADAFSEGKKPSGMK